MSGDRIDRLVWGRIDGTLSREEDRQLDRHLERNPSDRELFTTVEAFAELLGGVGEIDPPRELHGRILAALDSVPPARPGFFARLRSAMWPDDATALKFVAVAAGSFAVGVIGYHMVNYQSHGNRSLDISKIYGSMNVDTDSHRILDIDLAGVQGTLKFEKRGGVVISEVEIDSEGEVEVSLNYAGNSARFGGLDPSAEPGGRITVEGSRVTLVNEGSGKYLVMIDVDPRIHSFITVHVSSGGDVLLERLVDPAEL